MERVILHSDLNNFFASVEAISSPEYAGQDKYIAVCGLEEDRHGIVLAKNENAKRMGVKTGDTIWKAKQKCPALITIPPHFDRYRRYSKLMHRIYSDYTDEIEAFGMDECWLDVTHSTSLFGSGKTIAETIRERVKRETGLTVSIGVSFNKIFAKLGSDLKKPDAVTVISKSNFKEKVWPLGAGELLGVGRKTLDMLERHGIFTIGDIARTPQKYLTDMLGKCGGDLYAYANGLDDTPIAHTSYDPPPKSISHGVTCKSDLVSYEEASRVLLYLAGDISSRLREKELLCSHVSVIVRDATLHTHDCGKKLSLPERSRSVIYDAARSLLISSYDMSRPIRALTILTSSLVPDTEPVTIDLFTDTARAEKRETKERTADMLCKRFGKNALIPAALLIDSKLPSVINESILPGSIKVSL